MPRIITAGLIAVTLLAASLASAAGQTPTPTTAPSSPPAPSPTSMPGGVFPPAPQTFTGRLPVPSGFGLVTWNGGQLDTLIPEAERLGCRASAVFVTREGAFVGYVFGAPALPNEAFVRLYPGAVVPAGTPLIVVCAIVTAPAPIDRVQLRQLFHDFLVGAAPGVQHTSSYSVLITSGLPGGCVRFHGHELRRDGDTFAITVLNRVPPPGAQIACTAIYGMVETSIGLGTTGNELVEGRTYTVRVNGGNDITFRASR